MNLIFRKGTKAGLKKLLRKFFVILILPGSKSYEKVLDYFETKDIKFDAVYKYVDEINYLENYSFILEELLRPYSIEFLLIVTCSELEYLEYSELKGEDLIVSENFRFFG